MIRSSLRRAAGASALVLGLAGAAVWPGHARDAAGDAPALDVLAERPSGEDAAPADREALSPADAELVAMIETLLDEIDALAAELEGAPVVAEERAELEALRGRVSGLLDLARSLGIDDAVLADVSADAADEEPASPANAAAAEPPQTDVAEIAPVEEPTIAAIADMPAMPPEEPQRAEEVAEEIADGNVAEEAAVATVRDLAPGLKAGDVADSAPTEAPVITAVPEPRSAPPVPLATPPRDDEVADAVADESADGLPEEVSDSAPQDLASQELAPQDTGPEAGTATAAVPDLPPTPRVEQRSDEVSDVAVVPQPPPAPPREEEEEAERIAALLPAEEPLDEVVADPASPVEAILPPPRPPLVGEPALPQVAEAIVAAFDEPTTTGAIAPAVRPPPRPDDLRVARADPPPARVERAPVAAAPRHVAREPAVVLRRALGRAPGRAPEPVPQAAPKPALALPYALRP